MAVTVNVQNRFQIIVPVRVDRAVRGAPQLDAPDVDDRGWVNNRATGLNRDDARGALFGTTVGDVVRLKVVREDLDDSVSLFVTVTGDQVAIDQPAGGGPLPNTGIFTVRSVADTTVGSKIQVHLGSAGGPVICEADAHTFTPKTFRVTPHVCTIHHAANAAAGAGQAPTVNGAVLDDAQLTTIFDTIVRPIWRPAGVEFTVGAAQPETFVGFTQDDVALLASGEIRRVMATHRQANTCNIYFLRITDDFLGLGLNFEFVDSQAGDPNRFSDVPGIMIGVNGSRDGTTGNIFFRPSAGANLIQELGNDIAHEIGHFLTLNHADNINADANAVPPTPDGRLDTYNRRFLMHPINLLPNAVTPQTATSVPRLNDIGYGTGGGGSPHRGCLITLKHHPSHTSDGEVISVRRAFQSARRFS
jgi:hypothetical protein